MAESNDNDNDEVETTLQPTSAVSKTDSCESGIFSDVSPPAKAEVRTDENVEDIIQRVLNNRRQTFSDESAIYRRRRFQRTSEFDEEEVFEERYENGIDYIPDEEFIPKKGLHTEKVVREKSASIRNVVDDQSKVLQRLKSVGESFDELQDEIRSIKQFMWENEARRAIFDDELSNLNMSEEEDEHFRQEVKQHVPRSNPYRYTEEDYDTSYRSRNYRLERAETFDVGNRYASSSFASQSSNYSRATNSLMRSTSFQNSEEFPSNQLGKYPSDKWSFDSRFLKKVREAKASGEYKPKKPFQSRFLKKSNSPANTTTNNDSSAE